MPLSRRPRLLAAGLVAGSLVPLAAPAAADTGPASTQLPRFGRIVVDEAHGRLYVSGGTNSFGVQVTDLSGQLIGTVDTPGAAVGMALSADGGTLWVAQPAYGRISRVDTATLHATSVGLPTGVCPGDLALRGDRLYVGHSCSGYTGQGPDGGVAVLDPASGAVVADTRLGPTRTPVVAAGPAGQVYAAEAGLSPTSLWLLDLAGAEPAVVAARASVCSNLRDLSARPDGSEVVTACGSPYRHDAWSAQKLEPVGSYPSGAYPDAGAWSADGGAFAAGVDDPYEPDVFVYRAGGSAPVRTVDFGPGEVLLPRGLAVSRDGSRVWAVTSAGTDVLVRSLDVPGSATSALKLAADPPVLFEGGGTTIGGSLWSNGAGVSGAPLTVSRALPGAAPVALPSVTTDAYGVFTFRDGPLPVGSYTYTVQFGGRTGVDPASATTQVEVRPGDSTLALSLQKGPERASVAGTVLLTYPSGPDAGRVVRVTRTSGSSVTRLPDATTDADGRVAFLDRSVPVGPLVYTATVDATVDHSGATAREQIQVLAGTSLTAAGPQTGAVAGNPLTVDGALMSGAPVVGAAVAVVRSGCVGDWRSTATTAADGTWSVTDPAPPAGSCAYAASYTGSEDLAAARAQASVAVAARTVQLGLEIVRGTGSSKKYVTVTGRLPAYHVNKTLELTAQPVGGVEVLLVRGDVDATGVLSVRHQPKTTTTYRVRYAGDDWYAKTVTEKTQ